MRQLCNLAYATLAEGRDRVQMAELEQALADPEEKQKVVDRLNRESMASLGIQPLIAPGVKRGDLSSR